MELNDYKYGFTMSLHEYTETIPTLWEETKVFQHLTQDKLTFRNLRKEILNICLVAMLWNSSRTSQIQALL
jgi:hypothetical protein